jgi:nitrate reductase cytochrome c-type subunit
MISSSNNRGRGPRRLRATALVILGAAMATAATAGIWGSDEEPDATKTPAAERSLRRAYDGAPPVIPHARVGVDCTRCHARQGMQVPDLGYAPPSPHEQTAGLSALSRCEQCHVFQTTNEVWRGSDFEPLRQDLRQGLRFHPLAPPVIPHKVFMRENCAACHTGPAAREEIRSSHPERDRCRQCHLEQRTTDEFARKEQP